MCLMSLLHQEDTNAFCQSLFHSQQNRTNINFLWIFLEAYIVPMIPFWLPL